MPVRGSVSRLVALLALLAGAAVTHADQGNCAGNLDRSNLANPVVELRTSQGSVCIELLQDQAPLTVANFLAYLRAGVMDGTFFHRVVPGFVLQGGGFRVAASGVKVEPVPSAAPVVNEPCTLDQAVPGNAGTLRCSSRGNTRGTLAMAKIGGDPDSATNQWFVNMADNRANLDNQNGGFTVFARVLGEGMAVVDAIAGLPVLRNAAYNLNAEPVTRLSGFRSLPVTEQPGEPPGGSGCFDVNRLAVTFSDLGQDNCGTSAPGFSHDSCNRGLPDTSSAEPSGFAVVSGACGVALGDPTDFVASASESSTCSTPDRFAWGVQENASGDLVFSVSQDSLKIPYGLTCAQVQASNAHLAQRRSAMTPLTAQKLVYLETAALSPEVVSPVPGSELQATGQTITWEANGTSAQAWRLSLGSSPGGDQFGVRTVEDPDATAVTFDALPFQGGTVHATLAWRVAGQWRAANSRHHVFVAPRVLPQMVSSPVLAGHTEVFDWIFPSGLEVRRWQVSVGTREGAGDIMGSRTLPGEVTELSVPGLPTQGGQVFVTLALDAGDGFGDATSFVFQGADLPPPSLVPDEGVLSAGEVVLALEDGGNDVTHWRVEVAELSSRGRDRRLFRKRPRRGETQVMVAGLPTSGEPLVVRLDYRLSGGPWHTRYLRYQAVVADQPAILSPDPGVGGQQQLATGNSARGTVAFAWSTGGQPVRDWRLELGTTRGGADLFRSRRLGADTLSLDTGRVFPQSPVHARLHYRVRGQPDRYVDYLYNPQTEVVRPYYPAASDMGLVAPVLDDGPDAFSASGRLCRGGERGGYGACLPAGLMKVMTLPASVTGCDEVTAADVLDALEWTCRRTGSRVEVVSVGLKGSIAALLDVSTPGAPRFGENRVTVHQGAVEVARSELDAWWDTPVLPLPADGLMRDPDTVYVVEDAGTGVALVLDRAPRSVLAASPALAAPVTGSGEAQAAVVTLRRSPFARLTGDFAGGGEHAVVIVERSPFAAVTDAGISGAVDDVAAGRRGFGLHIARSNSAWVSGVRLFHNEAAGLVVQRSAGVGVRDAASVLNGEGVLLDRASGSRLHGLRVGHNVLGGITLSNSSDNRLNELVVHGNGGQAGPGNGHGIQVLGPGSRRNIIASAQVFNNAGHGLLLDRARDSLLSNLTVFNQGGGGVVLAGARNTTVLSLAALNNAQAGLEMRGGARGSNVRDLVSAHNAVGVELTGRSRSNTFGGRLALGDNAQTCEVEARSGDLEHATCAPLGGSTHTLITGIDASGSIVGKVSSGGPVDDGTAPQAALEAAPLLLLDVGDRAASRGYGRGGGAFPSAGNRGPCDTAGTCQLWSGAARSGDTGDAGGPVMAGVLAVPGPRDVVVHRLRSAVVVLQHATEIGADGLGNDDGLCESGENCLLDRNVGAYQGEPGDGEPDVVIDFDLAPPSRREPPAVEDVVLDARTATTVAPLP